MSALPRPTWLARLARASPRRQVLLAGASGAVFAISATPPASFAPGVGASLVGLATTLRSGDARSGAAAGAAFGLAANVVALRFVPTVVERFTPLPWAAAVLALVLLAAAQAVPWAVGGAVARALDRRTRAGAALAFGLGIYAAAFVPAVFPWTPASGLAATAALVQAAELVGERGTTFLWAVVGGLLAAAMDGASTARRRALAATCAVVLLAATAGIGAARVRAVSEARARAPRLRVALVQPGFEAAERWEPARATSMLERLTALTEQAERRGAQLVVWPESAYPYTLDHAARRAPVGSRAVLQGAVRGPVLTGAYLADASGGYNAAFVATADGAISRPYDKRHLLWFGETVPLADVFPWLRRTFARGTGLVPGHAAVRFDVGSARISVLNCYEDTLPSAGREAMTVAPNLLVNVTNDAWFEGTVEGELHLRLATLRAIETRRDLARAVNRGPTGLVDASGIPGDTSRGGGPTIVMADAALLDEVTPYTRFGDGPLIGLAAMATALAAFARAPAARRRARRA